MINYYAQGFTLFECLVVLFLIALMSSISMMHHGFFSRLTTHAEVDKLHMACMYVHYVSHATQHQQVIAFDPSAHSYSFLGYCEKLPPDIMFGAPAHAYGPPSHPKHPITDPITFAHNRIVFLPSGTTQAGSVYVTSRDGKNSYALTSPVAHHCSLRLYHYTSPWHAIK